MRNVGIDLSMRSAGLCATTAPMVVDFTLVQRKEDGPELLLAVWADIEVFLKKHEPDVINIEGLSFGSISGSKDIIAGLFWFVYVMIYKNFPDAKINVVPVLSWRSPLFSKEERKLIKDNTAKLKLVKKLLKGIKGNARKEAVLEHEEVILGANIKHQTFLKLPTKTQKQILEISEKDAKYDLTDAYFLACYIPKQK